MQSKLNKSASGVKSSNVKTKKQAPTAWKDRISHQDYEQLRDVFLLFDEDGSGTIDPQQIVKVLEQMGLNNRSPYVFKIVEAMREANKALNFEEFVNVVCSQVGEYKTRDGLQRIWKLYDKEDNGFIRFEQLKDISRTVGQHMDDNALLNMMHSVFINQKTQSNEEFTFEQFYQVIANYYSRQQI